jgi:hypothetical protein
MVAVKLLVRILVMVGAVSGSIARAEERADESAQAARERQSRSYFAIGASHYSLGEYEEAIAAFQAGYRSKPLPLFLFNIAQSARKAGKPELAVDYYRQYLEREPLVSAPQRAEAQLELERLQKRLAAQPPAPPVRSVAEPAVAAPSVVAISTPAPAPRVRSGRGWIWGVVAGVVVAGAAVGVGLGLGLQPSAPHPSLGTITFF